MTHDPTRSRPGYADPTARKLVAPAAERNSGPIAEALRDLLAGGTGAVVEIGAGTGQHAVACAAALPHLRWLPTDPDAVHCGSIAAWREDAGLANLQPPRRLDATGDWAKEVADARPVRAVYCSNVIHISPWEVAEGLVAGAGRLLEPGGLLILYGPFFENGQASEGNLAFDATLRERDAGWGVRDVADVTALARTAGFAPPRRIAMPASNLILAFARAELGAGDGPA